jgi:hypothetical protein
MACSSDDRPASIDPGGQSRVDNGGAGGELVSGSSGWGGADDGGSGGADYDDCASADGGTSFTGDLNLFADAALDETDVLLYAGSAELRALGTSDCWSVATYDGATTDSEYERPVFVLEGREPLDNAPTLIDWAGDGTELFPTIMMLYSAEDAEAFGAVMALTTAQMESIAEQAGVTIMDDRAHLILRIFAFNVPVAGVEVEGGSATVAYEDGGWSASATATGSSGLVALFNLEVESELYDQRTFALRGPEGTDLLGFPLRRGYVTYAQEVHITAVEDF